MAEASGTQGRSATASGGGGVSLRVLWPVPVLAVAGMLLVAGLVVAAKRAPKADPLEPLAHAKEALAAHDYKKVIDIVNDELLPGMAAGTISERDGADVLLTRARALAAGQQRLGISHPENNRAIVDDYRQAERQGAKFEPPDVSQLAEATLALGDTAKAVELAKSLPDSEASRRMALFRRVVDVSLASKEPKFDSTLALLNELLESPVLEIDDRGWAVARQTEMRLAMGFHEEAITKLLRAIPKLEGLTPGRRGELFYLLGKAYFELGQFAAASKQLEAAEAELPEHNPLRGDALVLAGRILQAAGRIDSARERFLAVRENFANTPALLPALLGLGETTAVEHDDDAALETYRELMTQLRREPDRRHGVTWQQVGASLFERFGTRDAAREYVPALRFAKLAEEAFDHDGEVPADLLAALARTTRIIAENMLEEARTTEQGRLPIDQVSPVTQAEAKRHLLDAGTYFRRHAARVLTNDIAAYRESLWNGADSFDLGGDSQNALVAFNQYVQETPQDDPRHAEAVFRYGQILESEGKFSDAAAEYAKLVDARGTSGQGVGPVADRSIVPLARCYLQDSLAENDKTAEDLLASAISGATLQPDSTVYRDALVELGEYKHRAGKFAEAIAHLSEAAARYADHPRVHVIRYKLADSCRLAAAVIDTELKEAMPQARREELERLRHDRLTTAAATYQQVVEGVDAKDRRRVTELEKLVRRNSSFYVGDCAFELGDYQRAIEEYDVARQRYSEDPASLVAMVQIVSSYVAQKKWAEALTANDRARQQLAGLPDNVWQTPDLPMERRHWERWLDSSTLLEARRRAQALVEPGQE